MMLGLVEDLSEDFKEKIVQDKSPFMFRVVRLMLLSWWRNDPATAVMGQMIILKQKGLVDVC